MIARAGRPATLRDVAERAGVSISTASRVLSGGASVRSRLADRVRQAAAELEYRPNLTARSLRRAESMTFGVVFYKLDGPPAWQAFRGLESEARVHGYATVSADADGDEERFIELFTRLAERQVDVIFVYRPPREAEAIIDQTVADGTPVIAISQRPRGMRIPLVTNRPTESTAAAVRRLVDLGHDYIAYVGGHGEFGDFRTETLREAADQWNFRFHEEELADEVDRDFFARAPEVIDRLHEAGVTAIFARYPYIAGLLNAVDVRGYAVPRDFSLIAFGDGPWLRAARPRISTVRGDPHAVGEVAARVGVEALAGAKLARTYQPSDAVWEERDSIGPAPRRPRSRWVRFLGS